MRKQLVFGMILAAVLLASPAHALGPDLCHSFELLLNETNSEGTMTVSKAQCMSGPRVTGIFASSQGGTVVLSARPGYSELQLPTALITTALLGDGRLAFTALTTEDSYSFTLNSDGTPATPADEQVIADLSSALEPGLGSVAQAAFDFNLAMGYDPIAVIEGTGLPSWVRCGLASAGLIGSYGALIGLTGGVGAVAVIVAVGMHNIAVISFVDSCFTD
jgi:hypothetical protein